MKQKIKSGYGIVQRDFMKDKDLDVYEKAVYCLLCSYSGSKGQCWPSKATMRTDLKISKDKLNKCLIKLEHLGWVGIEKSEGGSTKNTNRYFPYFEADSRGTPDVPVRGAAPQGDVEQPGRGTPDVPVGGRGASPNINSKKSNNKSNSKTNISSDEKSLGENKNQIFRDVFEGFYLEKFHTAYYWEAKDAGAGSSIVKKIIFKIKEGGGDPEAKDFLKNSIRIFLSKAIVYGSDFTKNNFCVTELNRVFTPLYTAIKEKKKINGFSKEKPRLAKAHDPLYILNGEGEQDS